MGVFDKLLRAGEGKKLRAIQALVPDINALEPEIQALTDEQLAHRTVEFRERLANGADLDDLLIEAFAVVREASLREIGQRHYDVQLMGGAALHFGWVAEMKTGEGKTLVSTLPVYLNALSGDGVHVITVNDYLATRDSEWMGRVHRRLGLDVGLIVPGDFSPEYKRQQYHSDITYGTNNEFGFDYLRDNMAMSRADQVQRGLNFCIVDEVDSILIDEARTPLIISGRIADAAKIYYQFASIVRGLQRDIHYDVDEEKRTVAPTDAGVEAVERALSVQNMYDEVSQNLVHQLQAALKAKELFKRDKEYVVQNGEVRIVDEFTGRILEGRRWSEGLHQAVEAKEGVKIKEENQTLATITLQNYFRMYDKLAGMTGTAETEASEFASTYGLHVVPIPTHRPLARIDQGDLIYKTESAKFDAVVDAVDAAVRDAVGDREGVLLPLTVEEGVGGGVPVPLPVALAVALPVGVCVGEGDALKEALPELEAEAPCVRDAVGEPDGVAVVEPLSGPLAVALPLGDEVPEVEGLTPAGRSPPLQERSTSCSHRGKKPPIK